MKKLLLSLLFVGIASVANAQATFTAKDAAGATQTFKSFNCTANICSLSVPADSTGAAFGVTANPFFMAFGTGVTLPAYAAIPTFKIDQTTPGTTNAVQVTNFPSGIYSYIPLSPMQSGLAVASSTALTIPVGTTYAIVCAEGSNVRYTTDGTTTPTAAVGMPLFQNQCVSLSGATVLSNFRAIQQSATATIDINYFR